MDKLNILVNLWLRNQVVSEVGRLWAALQEYRGRAVLPAEGITEFFLSDGKVLVADGPAVVEVDRAWACLGPCVDREVALWQQVENRDALGLKFLEQAALYVHRGARKYFPKLGIKQLVVIQIEIDPHEVKYQMIAHVWDAFVFMYLSVGSSDNLLGLDRASGMIHKACGFLFICGYYVVLCVQMLIVT